MKLGLLSLLIASVSADEINSSRVSCESGDNEYCETVDYEGACCASMTVVSVDANGSGRNEVNGAQFFACLNIDDIIDAYDNNDVLKGSLNNANGNGNNYSI